MKRDTKLMLYCCVLSDNELINLFKEIPFSNCFVVDVSQRLHLKINLLVHCRKEPNRSFKITQSFFWKQLCRTSNRLIWMQMLTNRFTWLFCRSRRIILLMGPNRSVFQCLNNYNTLQL